MKKQNNKSNRLKIKTKIQKFHQNHKHKKNYNLLLIITFFIGVVLIYCTYAWFYASLNVKIEFLNLIVSDESGLFISFDGIEYGGSVEISKRSVIDDLKKAYPNHTNQWATGGLFAASSNGIPNSNSERFSMYAASKIAKNPERGHLRNLLNTELLEEPKASANNIYIAFDLFLKNVSGSPKSDNLYLKEGTSVYFDDKESTDSDGSINSIRFGFVKIGSTSSKSDIKTIQNLKCNNKCEMIIFEPNSTIHSNESIQRAKKHGVDLVDGKTYSTYAVIKEGENLELAGGHPGSNIKLDNEHFALQRTKTDFEKSIFPIPNGVTKVRVYIWIEGQDIDSLETRPKGAAISIAINFFKDLAGYY